jgi:hypothetical protein
MTADPRAEGTRTNLTITVDQDVLRRARLRALSEDTSVNAFLRGCLERYADEGDSAAKAVAGARALMDAGALHWGSRTWSREDLYER